MGNTRCRVAIRVGAGVALGFAALFIAGCGSTIHDQANIGGVDTLSIDAKQRLVLVGDRSSNHGGPQARIECAEPSPDAIVAKAAAFAAGVSLTGTTAGGGNIGGGSSEAAASIGFRDHTVQMLRDAYYRMCEAYMNGALSEESYRNMILNADTFMVVATALQSLGTNPVAAPVAITAGAVSTSTAADKSISVTVGPPQLAVGGAVAPATQNVLIGSNVAGPTISDQNATAAARIINEYLAYRERLRKDLKRADAADKHAARTRY